MLHLEVWAAPMDGLRKVWKALEGAHGCPFAHFQLKSLGRAVDETRGKPETANPVISPKFP